MERFTKITVGFVTQSYKKTTAGKFICTGQEFVAGDQVDFEDSEGNAITECEHDYQPFNMTLLSKGKIVYCIKEMLEILNVGGEQSRQFAREIELLDTLLKSLVRTLRD